MSRNLTAGQANKVPSHAPTLGLLWAGSREGRKGPVPGQRRGTALDLGGPPSAPQGQEPRSCMALGWGQPMSLLGKIWKAEKRKEQIVILQWPLQADIQADQIYGPKSNHPLWGCRQVQLQAGAATGRCRRQRRPPRRLRREAQDGPRDRGCASPAMRPFPSPSEGRANPNLLDSMLSYLGCLRTPS